MPLAIPVATGSGTELIAAGMNALRGVTSIRSGSLFVNPVAVGVIGTFYSNKLNAGEKDILSDSQLAALAGKFAPTRIRFQWVKDNYGRLTPVAYHTGADCGQDQVRVRAMRRNTFTGNYEFWADGAEKPIIIWTPDELEFKAPTNTGNRDEPYLPSTITVLPLPGAEEMGSTSTSLPIPDESSFDDYILVNLPHGMPPVYIYLSQSRSGIPNKDYDYHPAPETEEISGLSGLRQSKKKTPKQSGGGLRERWVDSKGRRIYEWDSQHGELEEYRASNGEHLGSVDHKTGQQLKPAVKGRNIKRYL